MKKNLKRNKNKGRDCKDIERLQRRMKKLNPIKDGYCAQVAVDVMAGLLTLLKNDLESKVYFTSQLYDKGY